MDRLTEHDGEYIRIKGCKTLYASQERKGAPASNAIARLAAYEDFLERLGCEIDDISRVAAELDAALADVPHECCTCKHKPQKYGVCGMGCEVGPLEIDHAQRCNWEWSGAQSELDAEANDQQVKKALNDAGFDTTEDFTCTHRQVKGEE